MMERRILEEYGRAQDAAPPGSRRPGKPPRARRETKPRGENRPDWGVAKLVRHRPLEPAFLGSSPSAPAISSTAVPLAHSRDDHGVSLEWRVPEWSVPE